MLCGNDQSLEVENPTLFLGGGGKGGRGGEKYVEGTEKRGIFMVVSQHFCPSLSECEMLSQHK